MFDCVYQRTGWFLLFTGAYEIIIWVIFITDPLSGEKKKHLRIDASWIKFIFSDI